MNAESTVEPALSLEAREYYADKRLLWLNSFWLLFGTFGMGMGLGVSANLVPLHMSKVGMNATQIALGFSINGWLIAFLMIYLAYRSDNCQIRWGRRLPFLLLAIPPVCLALIIFPHAHTIFACVVVFAVYRFFLNFKEQTYPFLSYDIAPRECWGRIWALQMAGGALGGWAANVGLMRLVKPWGEAPVFYLASGMLGGLTLVTILFLKEPPIRVKNPAPFQIGKQLLIGFGDRRNWLLFLGFGLGIMTALPAPIFIVLQAKNNVLLDEGQIGWVMSWFTLASLVIAFPAGWLTDRLGAIQAMGISYVLALVAAFLGFAADGATRLSFSVVFLALSGTISYNAMLVFLVRGVPREIIASFSACNGMFSAFFAATVQVACGSLIDLFGGNYGIAFPLGVLLGGVGLAMLIVVDQWRKKELKSNQAASFRESSSASLKKLAKMDAGS
ncbi:hypothetical protein BH09VER1_BH09VER1_17270 [soil metagenome]